MAKIQTSRQIASKNLKKLMEDSDDLNTLEKLASKTTKGRGTIDRMKKAEVAITVDTLDEVARAFKIQPWQLVHPDLGMMIAAENEDEAQILLAYRSASDIGKQAIKMTMRGAKRDIASEQSVPDNLAQIQKK